MIEINEAFITTYSKKIMGFAFSKTRNTYLAEDLAQDILLQLLAAIKKNPNIESMDSYVYTLCCYTWSKFLRTNKKHWNHQDVNQVIDLSDEVDLSQVVEETILIRKIKEEIGYLGSQHRKIMIMTYFENKKASEIAQELQLNASTVRWYLGEIRKQIKERIEMNSGHLNYEPKRLLVAWNGETFDERMSGLKGDLLTQNITIVCYGAPLTLTEISRKLGVGAAYIEGIIEKLVYMDYLKVVGTKYQTNFFIDTPYHQLVRSNYQLEHIRPIAEKIKHVVNEHFDDIQAIGFLGSDLKEEKLKWLIICCLADELEQQSRTLLNGGKKREHPKRKDGSCHCVSARLDEIKTYLQTEHPFRDEVIAFHRSSGGLIHKKVEGDFTNLIEFEIVFDQDLDPKWRPINTTLLNNLSRIKTLIQNNQKLNEYDKLMVSELVCEGFLKVENEEIRFLVPYLSAEGMKTFMELIKKMADQLGLDEVNHFLKSFRIEYEKEMPAFLDEEIRVFEQYSISLLRAVVNWILYQNQHNKPHSSQLETLMLTMVWEK